MDRRLALAKATIDEPSVTAGLLLPEQARAFIVTIKDQSVLLSKMRQEIRTASTGFIDKLTTGSRMIRKATEDSDDGYRVGATFGSVQYTTEKIRLPWEVTEDVFHENIEQEGFENTLTGDMTKQFGLDLEDLAVNGDTADVSADAPFLTINDGIIKQIAAAAGSFPGRNIDGSAINAGNIAKEHFYAALTAMPNKYRRQGGLVWIVSPNRAISYAEYLTARVGAAADALLGARNDQPAGPSMATNPLGIPMLEVPAWPDHTIVLADPSNFVRVTTWDVRKRKVTGETDAQLAALDKRFYVFFLKEDYIILELNAIVRVYNLNAPA